MYRCFTYFFSPANYCDSRLLGNPIFDYSLVVKHLKIGIRDILWANVGIHPESSIFQSCNPHSKVSLEEAKIQNFTIHSQLKSKTNTFPTTWLKRLDSILLARQLLGLSTSISSFKLISDALDTTPRYVHKVGIRLISDRFTRFPIVSLLIFPAHMISLWVQIISFLKPTLI